MKAMEAKEDSLVNRVAKALYDNQVKQAREHIDTLPFAPEEVEDLAVRLRNESQTAQVLIFYSYLDDRIQQLIQLQLRPNQSKVETDRLFGLSGPLNTFNSRILLAYHLGWLSDRTRNKLDAFRRIRNEFAHRAFKIKIDDPSLKSHLETLNYDIPAIMRKAGIEQPARFENLLCQLVLLALHTFEDMIVMPAAKQRNVSPNDVAGAFSDAPALLKKISLTMSAAIMLAAGLDISRPGPEEPAALALKGVDG